MSKLQEKPSTLKREHPALKKMKFNSFFYVCGSFLSSRIPLNPDPQHCVKVPSLHKIISNFCSKHQLIPVV